MPPSNAIVVSGAREHNLKNVSLELPRDALVVITGLSGSASPRSPSTRSTPRASAATSSRCSAYARQFLGQMDKPDVDSIEGLSPAISIDQKTTSRNPRSTVGTVTEIYDYLRLLWARVGHPHCLQLRRADRRPVGRADHRPGHGARRGHALHGAGADRARPQGRVRQAVRGAARRRLRAREGRRRAARPRRGRSSSTRSSSTTSRSSSTGSSMRPDLRKRLADSIETAVGAGRRDRRDRDRPARGRRASRRS